MSMASGIMRGQYTRFIPNFDKKLLVMLAV